MKENVLMVSVGLAPQVVTETLHAIHVEGGDLPDGLVILTTPRGEQLVRAHLLDKPEGQIWRWGQEWRLEAATSRLLENVEVLVVESDSGDMETPRAVASFLQVVGERIDYLTRRQDTAVHISIAGGRKIAAALLAVTAALHLRKHDRVSQVLVEPEEAASSDFFFPTRKSKKIYTAGGRTIDAANVQLRLVDLPLGGVGAREGEAIAKRLQAWATEALDAPRLEIRLHEGKILWDGIPHEWPPQTLALLAALARDLLAGGSGIPRSGAPRKIISRELEKHPRARRLLLPDPLEETWLEEKVVRLNRLASNSGICPEGKRLVQRVGPWSRGRYRLAMSADQIRLNDEGG